MIKDGTLVDVSKDMWIFSLPLSRRPTFVSMEMDDHLLVCDLLSFDDKCWKIQDVTCLFGSYLTDRILAVPILAHHSQDLRV